MGTNEDSSRDEYLPWYALKVGTRSEQLASDILRRKGFVEFCPVYEERRKWADRVKTISVAAFPGYTFCRFDWRDRLPVITSPAVEYVVGLGEYPAEIPEAEILSVRRAIKAGARPVPYYRVGQRVRVEVGPLAGVEGLLARHSSKNRLVVSIPLLQRAVAVQIGADEVVAIPPYQA